LACTKIAGNQIISSI